MTRRTLVVVMMMVMIMMMMRRLLVIRMDAGADHHQSSEDSRPIINARIQQWVLTVAAAVPELAVASSTDIKPGQVGGGVRTIPASRNSRDGWAR